MADALEGNPGSSGTDAAPHDLGGAVQGQGFPQDQQQMTSYLGDGSSLDMSSFDMSAYQNYIQVDPSSGVAYRFDPTTGNMSVMDPQPPPEQIQQMLVQQAQQQQQQFPAGDASQQQGGLDQASFMAMIQSNPQLMEFVSMHLQQGASPEMILQFFQQMAQNPELMGGDFQGQGPDGQGGDGQSAMFPGGPGGMQGMAGGPLQGSPSGQQKPEELVTYNWKGKQLTRRKRTKLTEEQIKVLESEYAMSTMPGPKVYKRISTQLGLSHDSVINWFQNRRKREKRHTQKLDDPSGGMNPLAAMALANPFFAAMMNPLLMMAMQQGGGPGGAGGAGGVPPMMNPLMMQMMMMQGMGMGPDGQPLSEGGMPPGMMPPEGMGGMMPPMSGMPQSDMDPSQLFPGFPFPPMMDPNLMLQMQQQGFGQPEGVGGMPNPAELSQGSPQSLAPPQQQQQSIMPSSQSNSVSPPPSMGMPSEVGGQSMLSPFGMTQQDHQQGQYTSSMTNGMPQSMGDNDVQQQFMNAQQTDNSLIPATTSQSQPLSQPIPDAAPSLTMNNAITSEQSLSSGTVPSSFFSMTSGAVDENGGQLQGHGGDGQLVDPSSHLLGGLLDTSGHSMENFSDPTQLLQSGAGSFASPIMNPFLLQQMGMGLGGVNPLFMMAALRGGLGPEDAGKFAAGRPSEFDCAACGQILPWSNKGTRVTMKNNLGPMIRQKREFYRKDFVIGDVFCLACHESSRGGIEDEPDDDFDEMMANRLRSRQGLNVPYKDRPAILSTLFEGLRFAFPRRLHALKYLVEQHSGSATFMTSKAIKKKEIRRMPDPPTHFVIPDDTVTENDPRVSELIKRGTVCINDRFVKSCIDTGHILGLENFPVRWKAAGMGGGDSDDSDHEGSGGQLQGQPDYSQMMQLMQQQLGSAGGANSLGPGGFQMSPMSQMSRDPSKTHLEIHFDHGRFENFEFLKNMSEDNFRATIFGAFDISPGTGVILRRLEDGSAVNLHPSLASGRYRLEIIEGSAGI